MTNWPRVIDPGVVNVDGYDCGLKAIGALVGPEMLPEIESE